MAKNDAASFAEILTRLEKIERRLDAHDARQPKTDDAPGLSATELIEAASRVPTMTEFEREILARARLKTAKSGVVPTDCRPILEDMVAGRRPATKDPEPVKASKPPEPTYRHRYNS